MAPNQMLEEEDHMGQPPPWSYMIPDYLEIPGYAYGDWLLILAMENSGHNSCCTRLWRCLKKKVKKLGNRLRKVQKKVADEWKELQYQRIIITNIIHQKASEVKDKLKNTLAEMRAPDYQPLL